MYLDNPEQWEELAQLCRDAGVIGLDTEFYNVNVTKQSCVGRAKIHVWSVALRTSKRSPLGFAKARGWVLPVAALGHFKALLEDRGVIKAVHNQSVDQHALANHGIGLRGAINTLGLVRWFRPELVSQEGRFGLKALMGALLRRVPVCSFKELVSDTRQIVVTKQKVVTVRECSCGEPACRKRKGHLKSTREELVDVSKEKTEKFQHRLEDIVPGHPRWELLVRYAAEDAVAALEIMELAEAEKDPAPFPFAPQRPSFSQALESVIIKMEAVGIPIDVPWCIGTLSQVMDDEEKAFDELYDWFLGNAPDDHRGLDRELIAKIWPSPKQRLRLFDSLGYPRSPVWKLGRVKRGESKVDGTAQAWIAKAHPRAKPLMDKLLVLQRIQAAKKYLGQMLASNGMAYPTCGPAGDNDERSGAVTGRTGIKGELSGQQIPTRDEVDPYHIKRGIAAWPT